MAETFGKKTKGSLEKGVTAFRIYAALFTSGSAGTLDSISVYFKNIGADRNCKCAIYDANRDLVSNGTTEEKAIPADQNGWMIFNFSTPPTVLAVTGYRLCMWLDNTAYYYYDDGDVDQLILDAEPYENEWPASLIQTSTYPRELSIYATYSEAPPPAAKTLVQAALISVPPLIVLPTLAEILKFAGGC